MIDPDIQPLPPADVQRLLDQLQSIAISPASADVAAGDIARVNALGRAAADTHCDFFDNPAHFTRALLEGRE